jgi:zinc transporter 1
LIEIDYSDDNFPQLSNSPHIPKKRSGNIDLLEVNFHKNSDSDSDSDSDSHDSHDEEHNYEEESRDMNFHAVFLHYLGDALSSIILVITGFLVKYFGEQSWTRYLDPSASILIVLLILWTTIPLLRSCSKILLQQIPASLNLPNLKEELSKVPGVLGIHDLHVWQLVDSLVIATLHVRILESDIVSFEKIASRVRRVFHRIGIHSITLQPEFIPEYNKGGSHCEQYCVKDCEEDWCCKEQESMPLVDYHSTTQ